MRQNRRRAERNRAAKSRLRHAIRELRRALTAQDAERAKTLLSETVSLVDKSLKKGILKENSAARFKSRLMARVQAAV